MSILAFLGLALSTLMRAPFAVAANPESVTVAMDFIDPVAITEVNPLQYGYLDVALGNLETIVIVPDDTVIDLFGRIVGGTQLAANLTVTATASLPITILVDNVSSATGYSLGTWLCNYDGAAVNSACDGSGYSETTVASATLRIGATLTGNGNAVLGTDNSTFDVTVNYQ